MVKPENRIKKHHDSYFKKTLDEWGAVANLNMRGELEIIVGGADAFETLQKQEEVTWLAEYQLKIFKALN